MLIRTVDYVWARAVRPVASTWLGQAGLAHRQPALGEISDVQLPV